MHTITYAEAMENFRLSLKFDDGTSGVVDLSDLAGRGVFEVWKEYDEFRKVTVGGETVYAR